MYVAVRVRGKRRRSPEVSDTLEMLLLKRKNNCMIYPQTKDFKGMLNLVKDFICYGEADEDLVKELIKKSSVNGKKIEECLMEVGYKKTDDLAKDILSGKVKIKDLRKKGLQLPVRLKNPKKGYDNIKKGFGQGGVLGNHGKEINEFIRRMI